MTEEGSPDPTELKGRLLPQFTDVAEALAWADEWVQRNQPSVLTDLKLYEDQHLNEFERSYGRGLSQFYVEYGALLDLVDEVNFHERSTWPAHRSIQFVLLAKNLKALHSAMDRLSKGFYEDALTLIRSSYDAFLRVVHVSCFPEEPYAVLVNRPPNGIRAFNATNLMRIELRLDWMAKYRIMSSYAHGNMHEAGAALRRASERSGTPERFGLELRYDERMIGVAFPFLEFVVLLYLRFTLERLLMSDGPSDSATVRCAQEATEFLTQKFRTMDRDYWPSTMNDVDYLFNLLAAADDGLDWRALRDMRPVVDVET